MKPEVDLDLLGLYVMDMLDDGERARVEQLVASDPAWAAALAREAAFDQRLAQVASHVPAPPAQAPAPQPAWWRRLRVALFPVAVLCALLLVVAPEPQDTSEAARYALVVRGGEQVSRGAPSAPGERVFTVGSVLHVSFAPDVAAPAPRVEVTLDGAPVVLPVTLAEGGGGVIEVTFGEGLPGWPEAGSHELVVSLNGVPQEPVRFDWQPASP